MDEVEVVGVWKEFSIEAPSFDLSRWNLVFLDFLRHFIRSHHYSIPETGLKGSF